MWEQGMEGMVGTEGKEKPVSHGWWLRNAKHVEGYQSFQSHSPNLSRPMCKRRAGT